MCLYSAEMTGMFTMISCKNETRNRLLRMRVDMGLKSYDQLLNLLIERADIEVPGVVK